MDPDFSLIQARLSHEDDLVNQRVSWLVNSQSFLLTAYAITLNGLAADASKPLAIVQRKLLNLLPDSRRRLRAAGLRSADRRPLCDSLNSGVSPRRNTRKIGCFLFPSRRPNFSESAHRS